MLPYIIGYAGSTGAAQPGYFALSNDPISKGIAGAVVSEGVSSALAASQFFTLSSRGTLTRMGTDATLQLIFNKGDMSE